MIFKGKVKPEVVSVEYQELNDDDPDRSILCDDYMPGQRLQDYNNGLWNYVGIRAVATVQIPLQLQTPYHTNIRFESPGGWGIESDSDEEYKQSVFQDELYELEKEIKEYGVDTKMLNKIIITKFPVKYKVTFEGGELYEHNSL
jgi:hypothetical protein